MSERKVIRQKPITNHSSLKENRILVTNDDGIYAPGLKALVNAISKFGEIVVVAPEKPRSGMSHAITMDVPIRVNPIEFKGAKQAYECTGTPVDCVKIALNEILKSPPKLCVAGINHGSNSSVSVLYSGTVGAAIEAGISGIPSIAFSLMDYSHNADMKAPAYFSSLIVEKILNNSLPAGITLNVNIPALSQNVIKGIKICRQAKGKWIEEFDVRKDPNQNTYYWLTGKYEGDDNANDTDIWALHNNYISIVPVQFDLTNYLLLESLTNIDFEK